MGELLSAVAGYFEQARWNYRPVEGRSVLELELHGKHALFPCVAIVDEESERLIFLSHYPVKVPEARRGAVLELLNRANASLAVGNFELDLDTGNLRYRTSVDVEGLGLPDALVRNVVLCNVSTADRFFPAVAMTLYAGAAPLDALAVLESPPAGEAN